MCPAGHMCVQQDVVRSFVKVPEFDKHLKKGGGHISRNVEKLTIKMKTIVRKPLMIKIIKLSLRSLDYGIHIYIYIYLYCNSHTDGYVVSQLTRVARHARCLNLESKSDQLCVSLITSQPSAVTT